MKLKSIFILVFVLFACPSIVFSSDILDFKGVDSFISSTLSIKYSLDTRENINGEESFHINLTHDGESKRVCQKDLKKKEGEFSKYITCNIQSKGPGRYVFDAKVINENTTIDSETSIVNFGSKKNESTLISFIDLEGNKTKVSLHIKGEYEEDVILEHIIPKTVIEEINSSNKDDVINTSEEFTILREDPVIAWNVDETPSKVNYTVSKNIDKSSKEGFKVGVEEKSSIKYLQYISVLIIVVIIAIVFKPLISKKKK